MSVKNTPVLFSDLQRNFAALKALSRDRNHSDTSELSAGILLIDVQFSDHV